MKILFKFKEIEMVEQPEITTTTDETGATITKTQNVKSAKTRHFALIKPNRVIREEADLYTRAQYGKAIQQGMIPMALLNKRFSNDDGILSEAQKADYANAFAELIDKEKEYQSLFIQKEEDRTEETKTKIKELETEIRILNEKIVSLQKTQNGLYDNTPEVWSRNKAISWFLLHLSYEEINGKLVPFFGEGDFKAKLARYDEIEEKEDEFLNRVTSRFMFATAIYYTGLASNQTQFEEIENKEKVNADAQS